GAADDYSSFNCSSGGFPQTFAVPGADVVFPIDIPAAGRLRVETSNSRSGLVMSVHPSPCATSSATACTRFSNRLETGAIAAGRYYLRVDNESAAALPYDFNLTLTLLAP
ncbi:MAG: hypothetical protein AAFU79_34845, partial [Myxococcota bacterium]